MQNQTTKKNLDKNTTSINEIFSKYKNSLEGFSAENKACMMKCTDKLLFPSEELTCYEKCEETYLNKLTHMKENLYNDFNKIIN